MSDQRVALPNPNINGAGGLLWTTIKEFPVCATIGNDPGDMVSAFTVLSLKHLFFQYFVVDI